MHVWGDRHYRFQTASMGKAFMWVLIGFAVEDGILDPDEPIHRTWTGEGELSHPHKHPEPRTPPDAHLAPPHRSEGP